MTRTSATGDSRPNGLSRAGFTLVELMVVMAVLGLLATVVVVAVPDGRMTLAVESERFAARLKRAQEEAVLTNRPVQAVLTPEGYGFRVRRAGGWQPLDEGPFRDETWLAGTVVAAAEPEPAHVTFDPTGVATPARFTLNRTSRSAEVSVDAAGNVRVDAR